MLQEMQAPGQLLSRLRPGAHTQVLEIGKLVGRGRDGAWTLAGVALLGTGSVAFTSLSLANLESIWQVINIFIINKK